VSARLRADIFGVSFGTKTEITETHGDFSGDAATERAGVEIRNDQSLIVDLVRSSAVEIASVKLNVRQDDILAEIVSPLPWYLPLTSLPSPWNFNYAGGYQRLARHFADVK